tara:strand:+ start:11031 stop:13685 length:2655 start_codon:yes stop_codon:yes gene_type:complete
MEVIKRNGKSEPIHFDKITRRISFLLNDDEKKIIDPIDIAKNTITNIYNNISTTELDILSSNICINNCLKHPYYERLASKICISNLHKETDEDYYNISKKLYNNYIDDIHTPLITKELFEIIKLNKEKIQSHIDYNNDYKFTYFGIKTLERSYLIKIKNIIIERPQQMLMRVSLGIHGKDLEKVFNTYKLMSEGKFIHASPTLFNSGTEFNQLSSCFLLGTEDSLTGIYETITDCAKISKRAGGIGVHVSNIRAKNSIIRGTNGKSNGIIPMLQVYNYTARYVNQGGRRPGSIAVYLEPWHADILEFLELRKNTGSEDNKARDLFLAVWIPDNFMEAVKNDSDWYLMCPDESPNLYNYYGSKYEELYNKYIDEKKYRECIKARYLWNKILESQIETGMPYIGFKDNINNKTNQQNIGVIKSSNLCIEICEYSDENETAVCNLSSIAVNKFIKEKHFDKEFTIYSKDNCEYCKLAKMLCKRFNYKYKEILLNDRKDRDKLYIKIDNEEDIIVNSMPQIYYNNKYIGGYQEFNVYIRPLYDYLELSKIAETVCENLNLIIDINHYPTIKCKRSNLKHRPIGIGIQGLSDLYNKMRYPFDSKEAMELNKNVMETIYYGAIKKSIELSKIREAKINKLFTLDKNSNEYTELYNELEFTIEDNTQFEKDIIRDNIKGSYSSFENSPFSKGILQFDMWKVLPSSRWDWDELKTNLKRYGCRNSLLTALMPTASTSQILGNNECFEPYTSNIYTRKTHAGEFYITNKSLIMDLINLGIWNTELKNKIIINNGSIQNIDEIPDSLKQLYKIVWEIPQKHIVQQAIDRGPFIDQSQSMNIFMAKPDVNRLQSCHFYAWKKGLKTGIYYLRSKPASNAIQITVDSTQECISCSG